MTPEDFIRGIADMLREFVPKEEGFALFLHHPKYPHPMYVSSGEREGMVAMLGEWLERGVGSGTAIGSQDVERATLEARCAYLAKALLKGFGESRIDVSLFLFDYSEGGNAAYFTSVPDRAAREIRAWVERHGSPS